MSFVFAKFVLKLNARKKTFVPTIFYILVLIRKFDHLNYLVLTLFRSRFPLTDVSSDIGYTC